MTRGTISLFWALRNRACCISDHVAETSNSSVLFAHRVTVLCFVLLLLLLFSVISKRQDSTALAASADLIACSTSTTLNSLPAQPLQSRKTTHKHAPNFPQDGGPQSRQYAHVRQRSTAAQWLTAQPVIHADPALIKWASTFPPYQDRDMAPKTKQKSPAIGAH